MHNSGGITYPACVKLWVPSRAPRKRRKRKRRERRKKKKKKSTVFSGLFSPLSLSASVRVARVRPSSLPSEPRLGRLIKKSSVSPVTKKNSKKQNQKKKKIQKQNKKRGDKNQPNKRGRTNLHLQAAGASRTSATQRGGLRPRAGALAGGSSGGQRPSDVLGATERRARLRPPRAAQGWGARSETGAK